MANPSRALRRIAGTLPNGDIKTNILTLAGELEAQHNDQNNAFQIAIGNAELGFDRQLDVLTKMIADLRNVCAAALAQSQDNAAQIADLRAVLDELAGERADDASAE